MPYFLEVPGLPLWELGLPVWQSRHTLPAPLIWRSQGLENLEELPNLHIQEAGLTTKHLLLW